MAYTIVQHTILAVAMGNPGPTGPLTWASAPTAGNLLVLALTMRGNATSAESLTNQGWIKATTVQNGTTCQTEIWYRVAGAGEGTGGPRFSGWANLTAGDEALAEVSGFSGTPTLDQT